MALKKELFMDIVLLPTNFTVLFIRLIDFLSENMRRIFGLVEQKR